MDPSHIRVLSNKERSRHHEKRWCNKERILHTGESQQSDEKYKYIDAFGNTNFVKSTPNERTEDKV